MSSDKKNVSRRDLVTLGAGIGGATVASSVPAFAQGIRGETPQLPSSTRQRSTRSLPMTQHNSRGQGWRAK